jgi:signal transduction histidine kinase
VGKINLNAALPIPVLDDIIPAFKASVGHTMTIGIADVQGHLYYGEPITYSHCTSASIQVGQEAIGQVAVSFDDPTIPAAPAADFLARALSHLATETWRREQFTDEVIARYDELNLIYGLGASFVQGAAREEIFATILEETNRIIRADAGIIYSWDAERSDVVPVSFFGHQFEVDSWNSRVREVALNTLNAYEEAQLFDAETVICAPLRYNEQLLGALVLVYEADDKTFKASDVSLLTTLTYNTSLFIYAIQLMGELAQRNTDLETALNELQQARDQLSRAERLSIIGNTVADLVHDMKKPLSNALGYAGLLQEENLTYEERNMFAGQIVRFVRVFSDMTQEILDYVKGDEIFRKVPMRVNDIMDEVSNMLMPPGLEQPVKIIMNYDEASNAMINVDPRFVRVFQNLVNNSIDAIEINGGTQVEISAHTDGSVVRFSVTDDGPGVPMNIVREIFEPFFTFGKPRGTGLGLAIVSRMVSVHGGEIRYEPAPGHGARFIFTVPLDGHSSE